MDTIEEIVGQEKRICYSCKQDKPLTVEHFQKNNLRKTNFSYRCKICDKAYRKKAINKNSPNDFVGKKYPDTYFTIKKDLGTRRLYGNTVRFFLVLCDCGREKEIAANILKGGRTKCCSHEDCQFVICNRQSQGSVILQDSKSGFKINYAIFNGIKSKAIRKSKTIQFDLTPEQIADQYKKQDGCCAITGLPLDGECKHKKTEWSVDRIDSNLGYTQDNIQIVHKFANMIKNKFDDKTMQLFCYLVYKNMSMNTVSQFNRMTFTDIKSVLRTALKKE